MFSQEAYRAALLKWIVISNQPFTEAQQKSFLELVRTLNPKAEPISNTTLKRDLMSTFKEQTEIMKLKLKVKYEIPNFIEL